MSVLINPYILAIAGGGGSNTFEDNFDDNSIDPALWSTTVGADIAIAETGGQMTLATDASYSGGGGNFSELVSVPSLDFAGATFQIDLVQMPVVGFSYNFLFYIYIYNTANANQNIYYQIQETDNGYFERANSGASHDDFFFTWDGSVTKIKFIHDNSVNEWQYWTFNGTTWTLEYTSLAATWNPTSCKIRIGAFISGPAANQTIILDNLITDATY